MLLYLKLFGDKIGELLCVVLSAESTVAEVKRVVENLRAVRVKRLLFAGHDLNEDDKTLGTL